MMAGYLVTRFFSVPRNITRRKNGKASLLVQPIPYSALGLRLRFWGAAGAALAAAGLRPGFLTAAASPVSSTILAAAAFFWIEAIPLSADFLSG
jgi:hypothetical protein